MLLLLDLYLGINFYERLNPDLYLLQMRVKYAV